MLYDREAAAKYCNITLANFDKIRTRGAQIPCPEPAGHIGRSPYWTRDQLDNWIAQRIDVTRGNPNWKAA